jgi:hypothetical protein
VDLAAHVRFLDQAIATQQATRRFQACWAVGLVVLGVAIVVAAQLLSGQVIPETFKWLLTFGGGFVSTIPGLPLVFSTRKERIAALTFLRDEIRRVQSAATPVDPKQAERLQELFWQFIGKSLGGS